MGGNLLIPIFSFLFHPLAIGGKVQRRDAVTVGRVHGGSLLQKLRRTVRALPVHRPMKWRPAEAIALVHRHPARDEE